ncbi:MAG TPA: FkbM family methyltransferase [Flavitalea sp.]|nr:FkbM family methyltransferase [Flavitalea sp.]
MNNYLQIIAMKLFDLKRIPASMRIQVIAAYFKNKLLGTKLIGKEEEVITYFRYLSKLKISHKKTVGNYFLVESPDYGQFYLRKPFSSDYKVFKQIFRDKEYLEFAQLIDASCPDDTISMIDGGANIGLTTIYMHHFFKGKKKIKSILVEPFKENIESAKLNMNIQGIDGVSYEIAGLYNKKCFLKIERSYGDGMEWAIQVVESPEQTDLPSLEISEILDKYQLRTLDALKLDIEGAERFLFEDETYASNFLKKVKVFAIELHKEYFIEDKVLDILRRNNFEIKKYQHTYIGSKKSAVTSA